MIFTGFQFSFNGPSAAINLLFNFPRKMIFIGIRIQQVNAIARKPIRVELKFDSVCIRKLSPGAFQNDSVYIRSQIYAAIDINLNKFHFPISCDFHRFLSATITDQVWRR